MLKTPYTPLKTKTQINSYVFKFEHVLTKTIYTSQAVSEDKARNNLCFRLCGTQKLHRDIFNSHLKLIYTSDPTYNKQYIQKIKQAEIQQDIQDDIWETYKKDCRKRFKGQHCKPYRIDNNLILLSKI